MNYRIIIPRSLHQALQAHLFQNHLEQGAFLLAQPERANGTLSLKAHNLYLISPDGWAIQSSVHLEMTDEQRAKVMKIGRDGGWSLIECHSHPGSGDDVAFSVSDYAGLDEFVPYVRWKLDGRPYAALVWGEASVDGCVWHDDFQVAHPVTSVLVKSLWGQKHISLARQNDFWTYIRRKLWSSR